MLVIGIDKCRLQGSFLPLVISAAFPWICCADNIDATICFRTEVSSHVCLYDCVTSEITYILKHAKEKRTDRMEINKEKSCQFGKRTLLLCIELLSYYPKWRTLYLTLCRKYMKKQPVFWTKNGLLLFLDIKIRGFTEKKHKSMVVINKSVGGILFKRSKIVKTDECRVVEVRYFVKFSQLAWINN